MCVTHSDFSKGVLKQLPCLSLSAAVHIVEIIYLCTLEMREIVFPPGVGWSVSQRGAGGFASVLASSPWASA